MKHSYSTRSEANWRRHDDAAIQFSEHGGPEVLRVVDVPVLSARPGQVRAAGSPAISESALADSANLFINPAEVSSPAMVKCHWNNVTCHLVIGSGARRAFPDNRRSRWVNSKERQH